VATTSKEPKVNTSTKRSTPWHLSGWGIAIIGYFTGGFAIPFLLWKKGPETPKRRKTMISWTVACLAIWVAVGVWSNSLPDADLTTESRGAETTSVETTSTSNKSPLKGGSTMPNVKTQILGDATDVLDSLDLNVDRDAKDIVAGRSIWDDRNWIVVSQAPNPGTQLKEGQKVCLGVRKIDEIDASVGGLDCFEDAIETDLKSEIADFYQDSGTDLIKLSVLNTSGQSAHYLVYMQISRDGLPTQKVPFCTYESVQSSTAPQSVILKVWEGSPGHDGYGGTFWRLLDWKGPFTHQIKSFERTFGASCFVLDD
jgi:hypothetical protein